jgi:hypothetical protein
MQQIENNLDAQMQEFLALCDEIDILENKQNSKEQGA